MMTYGDCVDWLKTAKPGDCIVYHTGSLALDRASNPTLVMVAEILLGAAGYRFIPDGHNTVRWAQLETPRVHLTQRKLTSVGNRGWPVFEYIATKR